VITTIQDANPAINPALSYSYPVGINDKGQIAGAFMPFRTGAWFRDSDGTITFINFGNTSINVVPCCINNVPEIALTVTLSLANSAITLNPLKTEPSPLPGPPQYDITYWGPGKGASNSPLGISSNGGYMVGVTKPFSLEPPQVFIQSAVGSPLLVSIPGALPVNAGPGQGGINTRGEAVIGGNSYIPAGGTPIAITISGGENVFATAINDLGWVTGQLPRLQGRRRPQGSCGESKTSPHRRSLAISVFRSGEPNRGVVGRRRVNVDPLDVLAGLQRLAVRFVAQHHDLRAAEEMTETHGAGGTEAGQPCRNPVAHQQQGPEGIAERSLSARTSTDQRH
jgi:hypothetical protein